MLEVVAKKKNKFRWMDKCQNDNKLFRMTYKSNKLSDYTSIFPQSGIWLCPSRFPRIMMFFHKPSKTYCTEASPQQYHLISNIDGFSAWKFSDGIFSVLAHSRIKKQQNTPNNILKTGWVFIYLFLSTVMQVWSRIARCKIYNLYISDFLIAWMYETKDIWLFLTKKGLILGPSPINSEHLALCPSCTKTSWYQYAPVGRKNGLTIFV